MNKRASNPFVLPIHLAGLGEEKLNKLCLALVCFAILAAGAAVTVAETSGWSRIGVWSLIEDAAFAAVRHPRNFIAFCLEVHAAGWLTPLSISAFVLFALFANFSLTAASRFMAGKLSGSMYFFYSRKSRRTGFPLAFLFLLSILGGGLLWIALLHPDDSLSLRVVRLIGIGVFVMFSCMLFGGSLAIVHEEHRKCFEALWRMVALAFSARGSFARAAVYTLPRWIGLGFMNWLALYFIVLVPFFISAALLGLLAPKYFSSTPLWFIAAGGYLRGEPYSSLPSGGILFIFFAGYFVVFSTAINLGRFLFFYPLAAGVCAFYSLRQEKEGLEYRSSMGSSQTKPGGKLLSAGQFLFKPGGSTALASLTPPRGWLALTVAGMSPATLLIFLATGSLAMILAWETSKEGSELPKVPLPVIILVLLILFLPVLCRRVGKFLTRDQFRKDGIRWFIRLFFLTASIWLLFLLYMGAAAIMIGLVAAIGLIPTIGPIVWPVLYVPMILCGVFVLVGIEKGIFGSMMLSPALAVDMGLKAKVSSALKHLDRRITQAQWAFLSIMLMGLPFALVPAVLGMILLSIMDLALPAGQGAGWLGIFISAWYGESVPQANWRDYLGAAIMLGLLLQGLTVAMTNAYLTVFHRQDWQRFLVGDLVLIGRQDILNGNDYPIAETEQYVGNLATIVSVGEKDSSGYDVVRVDLDNGQFTWRTENLIRT